MQRHIIARQVIEVRAPNREEAPALQARLSSLAGGDIEAVVDRCCSQLSAPDRVHRVGSIEVNLGRIEGENWEQDFLGKLESGLLAMLGVRIREEEEIAALSGEDPATSARLEVISLFARTGLLPFFVDSSRPEVVDEVMGELLAREEPRLVVLMEELFREPGALLRLVRRLRGERLLLLYRFLVSRPERADELWRLLSARAVISLVVPAALVWVGALRAACMGEARQGKPVDFWREALTFIAIEAGVTYKAFVAELFGIFGLEEEPIALAGTVHMLARELGIGGAEGLWVVREGISGSFARDPRVDADRPRGVIEETAEAMVIGSAPRARDPWVDANRPRGVIEETAESMVIGSAPRARDPWVDAYRPRGVIEETAEAMVIGSAPRARDPRVDAGRPRGVVEETAESMVIGSAPRARDPWVDAESLEGLVAEGPESKAQSSKSEVKTARSEVSAAAEAVAEAVAEAEAEAVAVAEAAADAAAAAEADAGAAVAAQRKARGVAEATARAAAAARANIAAAQWRRRKLHRPPQEEPEEAYVENAGLVLLWPFMGTFFERLGLTRENEFVDRAANHRAVGLLQHLATLEADPPEYRLPLLKILCGMPIDDVFDMGPEITEVEAAECEDLLRALLAHAPIFGEISAEGFRAAFLRRRGVLRADEGIWLLQVERAPYDVVLDRLPWAMSWIRFPWMEAPLCVAWGS